MFGRNKQRPLTPVEVIDRSIAHIGEHGFDSSSFGSHQHSACFIGTFNKVLGNARLNQREGPVLDVLLPALDEIALERLYPSKDGYYPSRATMLMKVNGSGRWAESLAHHHNDKTVLEVLRELRARVAPEPEKDLSNVPAFPARVGMRL